MNTSKIDLNTISEDDLLSVRLCDLPVAVEGTWLAECIADLYAELEQKGIMFKPQCYLADEWLTPEHQPVIGLPFYLAHPVLTRLEKKMMLEAEGETKSWCMKLLRHETGHALCYAYQLNHKKRWKDMFGSSSQEYGETYRFRPYSKNYVRHLDGFYAQYHPDEDFVETFAVWLTPQLDWEKQYHGWKVLQKLKYVDELMNEIKGKLPLIGKGRQSWHIKTLRMTLKNFYRKKTHLRQEDFPHFHDSNLKRIFAPQNAGTSEVLSAAEMIRKHRRQLVNDVAVWTGEKKYVVNDLVKTILKRCRALKLTGGESETVSLVRFSAYLTTLVMNYAYTGWYRGDQKKRKNPWQEK